MSWSLLDIIREGENRRDAGMQEAVDHADDVTPQWSQKAFNLFIQYTKEYRPRHQFQAEDFRVWCEQGKKIPDPPSKRAYGSIMVMAAKRNLIRSIGHATVKNVTAHRCFATLWEII